MMLCLSDADLVTVRRWLRTLRISLDAALVRARLLHRQRNDRYRAKHRRPYRKPAIVRVYKLCRRNHPPLAYQSKSGRLECRQCVLDRTRRYRQRQAA
jgi:hypothetical protein